MLEQHIVRCTRCLGVIPAGSEYITRRGRTSSLCRKCSHVSFDAKALTGIVEQPTPLQLETARRAGYLSRLVYQQRCPYPNDARRAAWLEGRRLAEERFPRAERKPPCSPTPNVPTPTTPPSTAA